MVFLGESNRGGVLQESHLFALEKDTDVLFPESHFKRSEKKGKDHGKENLPCKHRLQNGHLGIARAGSQRERVDKCQ